MLLIAIAAAVQSVPAVPAAIAGPPSPRTDQVEPPTPDEIRRSEAFAIAPSTERQADGSFRMPDVELDGYRCTVLNSKYAACSYRFREKRVGETSFGLWIDRQAVFARKDGSWSMLDADRNCYSPDPKAFPLYCVPDKRSRP